MTKIIEYEVGKYNGNPVVIRFANVSEEDARKVVDAFKKRLSGHLVLDGDIERATQVVNMEPATQKGPRQPDYFEGYKHHFSNEE